jgi:hypothetical protein
VKNASGQLRFLRDARRKTTTRPNWARTRGQPSMSGDRRCARLKRDASRVQISEPGVGGQIQERSSLKSRQTGRCCSHHCVGQRHYGADCAVIGWLAGGHMTGGGLQPDWASSARVRSSVQCVEMRDRKTNGVLKPRPLRVRQRARRLRATVEVSERQQELDRQREKREPRSKPDV